MDEVADEGRAFSWNWVFASVALYTLLEVLIAVVLAPALLVGHLASPMLQLTLEMLMHLGSYYLGGILVGVISPGIRLHEPAVGAFFSVALVFLTSFFMPHTFYHWDTFKVLIGGGIALLLALAGAYTGERLMGNIDANGEGRRARLRRSMWGEQGLLGGRRPGRLDP